jgi:ADP-ribose pyrophosphatase
VDWRKLDERVVYERFRRIVSRTYEVPDGRSADIEILESRDFVAVLALTPTQEVVLVRQFRPGPEKVVLEMPGGVVEDHQSPLDAARAELREESGYEGELIEVATLLVGAYSTARKHVFVAGDCRQVGPPDRAEFTEPVLVSLGAFREELRGGQMTNIDAGYRALDHLGLL